MGFRKKFKLLGDSDANQLTSKITKSKEKKISKNFTKKLIKLDKLPDLKFLSNFPIKYFKIFYKILRQYFLVGCVI